MNAALLRDPKTQRATPRAQTLTTLLQRPLFPLDGSSASLQVLTYCTSWLSASEAVSLLHVVPEDPPLDREDSAKPLDGPRARNYLMEVGKKLKSLDGRVDSIVEAGHPAETILEVAKREGATMIGMATHGHSGMLRWALGSQTEKVLRASDVPVLILPPVERGQPKREPARHILVPIDGSARALSLVPAVASLAKAHQIRVTLAHFVGTRASHAGAEQGAAWLHRARCAFEDAGVLPRTQLVPANPAEGIIEYRTSGSVESPPVDMIAMTTHGRTGLMRWALGSVTERVMRHTRLPLLTVRGTG